MTGLTMPEKQAPPVSGKTGGAGSPKHERHKRKAHVISAIERACNVAQNLRPSDVSAYFDRVQAWLPRALTSADLHKLSEQCGGGVYCRKQRAKWDRHGRYRHRLQLRQPQPEVFAFLSQLKGVHLNGLEVSLDWTFNDAYQLEQADWLVRSHWVKRWHGKQQVKAKHDTQYWAGKGGRNVPVCYSDRPSRITGEEYCLHLDWRISGKEALQRVGIGSIQNLLSFDFHQFWRTRLLFYAVDLRKLGRAYNNGLVLRKENRRQPWVKISKTRRFEYVFDYDLRRGFLIMRLDADGQSQRVIDRYNKLRLNPCLVRIEVPAQLLPERRQRREQVEVDQAGRRQSGPEQVSERFNACQIVESQRKSMSSCGLDSYIIHHGGRSAVAPIV
jgi:hypothetical protein